MSKLELTPRQKEVYDYIKGYISDEGQAPFQSEVASHFGISRRGVGDHLKYIEKKKYIQVSYRRKRGLVILK